MAESPQRVSVEAMSRKAIKLEGPADKPFAGIGRESRGRAVMLDTRQSEKTGEQDRALGALRLAQEAKQAQAKAEALAKAQAAQEEARQARKNAPTEIVRDRTPRYQKILRRLFGGK